MAGTKKYKRESDYYRRESREKEDLVGTAASARRSRDSEHSTHRRHGDKDEIHAAAGGQKNKDVDSEPWLEVGCVSFGPIIIESASALPIPEHCLHLVQHK